MSISSTSSSKVMAGRSRAAANGYRLTTTSSNGATQAPASCARWSARVQARFVIASQDWHRLLGDDRAAVEDVVDEVHRDARERHAGGERVAYGVCARERRQQGRMDVEDAVGEGPQDAWPDNPHVAC